jgi:antitoxin (DNA-binding transcriptional repressor) of toxin-antitoxin stability system
MTLVTIAEARENLPELLRRAAAGEQIVVTEDGKWLAALGAPPISVEASVPAPEDETTVIERREQLIREWLGLRADAPVPKPEAMPHEEYMTRYRKAG